MIISKIHAIKSLFICLMLTLLFTNVHAQSPIKIMLYGDSLMAGYGLPQQYNLASELSKEIKVNETMISFINASISGNTSKNGLSRVDWSLGDSPDIVILCLGANDMLRGIQPKETKNNLEKIIKTAQGKNIKVILAGMIAPTSYGIEYKSNFDQIYPDLSKQYNLPLIPFLLEGVALKPDLNLSDGMHPNEKGTIIISKTLQEMILKDISSN